MATGAANSPQVKTPSKFDLPPIQRVDRSQVKRIKQEGKK